jgi:hypothetical protein
MTVYGTTSDKQVVACTNRNKILSNGERRRMRVRQRVRYMISLHFIRLREERIGILINPKRDEKSGDVVRDLSSSTDFTQSAAANSR